MPFLRRSLAFACLSVVVGCGGRDGKASLGKGGDAGESNRDSGTSQSGGNDTNASTSGGVGPNGGTSAGASVAGSAQGGTNIGGTSSVASGGSLSGNGGTSSVASGGSSSGDGGNTSVASGGSLSGDGGTTSGGSSAGGSAGTSSGPVTAEVLEISDVWAGHPVGFTLLTRNNMQFVAYYDSQRRMTVASRSIGSASWTYKVLPSTVGWDSHNYVTMALDSTNQIHVSGNMHAVPLVYFRSTLALDTSSLVAVNTMIGTDESQVTYPIFFNGPAGNLIFEYRSGSSGNGNTIFNTYSTTTRSWSRTLSTVLLDGTSSSMNAYPEGPILGPDGYWHLVWVWRNTADASTNHDLSYARTPDLVHWYRGDGTAIALPITPTTGDIVDPVPVNGGMINNNTRIGFDAQNRPIIAYHKFDATGYTQLYEARLENGKWVIYCATNWTYRWNFGGTGTLVFAIGINEGPKLSSDGLLLQNYYHSQYGGYGTLILNPTTLHGDTTKAPPLRAYPVTLDTPESTYKDPVTLQSMVVRWAEDSGAGPDPQIKYLLRWETLPSNKDVARANIPPATKLRLYGFR